MRKSLQTYSVAHWPVLSSYSIERCLLTSLLSPPYRGGYVLVAEIASAYTGAITSRVERAHLILNSSIFLNDLYTILTR